MLVLTRKRGESLLIQAGPHSIEISHHRTQTGGCRLGIKADPEVFVISS